MWGQLRTRHHAAWASFLLLLASGGFLLVVLGNTPSADAQLVCANTMGVAQEWELNAAIECYNQNLTGTDTEIILFNNIDADGLVGPESLFTAIRGGGQLLINGQGFRIRRSSVPTSGAGQPILALIDDAPDDFAPFTELEIVDLEIELSPYDGAGILQVGHHDLRLRSVAITPSPGIGPTTTGITTTTNDDGDSGQLIMSSSIVHGAPIGIHVNTPTFILETSTISSTNIDIALESSGPSGIFNSTLAGPIGVEIGDGVIHVENSTIFGDGAATATAATGAITFKSSIVNTCSAPQLFGNDPGPGWANLGDNAGGCFVASEPVPLVLADNGCAIATPVGCPPTAAIDVWSPAHGVGRCDDGRAGPAEFDQRGEPRIPAGENCDAGAYELPCDGQNYDVPSVGAFNAAIGCYNSPTTPTGDYTLSLLNGLDLTDSFASRDSFLAGIEGLSPAGSLTIDGNGHALVAREPFGLPAEPGEPRRALLLMTGANQSTLRIRNLELTAELRSEVKYLVANRTSGALIIEDSALFNVERHAIDATGSGPMTISGSYVRSGNIVVSQDQAPLSIYGSTIGTTQDNIGWGLYMLGPLLIENSTFIRTFIFAESSVTGMIRNSTLQSSNIDGLGQITVESSIVDECNSPVSVIDGGNNVGTCFGTPVTHGPAEADRCATETPVGCPPVIALATGSPAFGAGDCTDVLVDQRGLARTPAGPGCDAGAYEAPCVGTVFDVTTVQQFNNAIDCHNAAIVESNFEINLLNDLVLTDTRDGADALTVPIYQEDSAVTLAINGNGFSLSEPARTRGTPTDPPPALSLITLAPDNQGPVEVLDLLVQTEPTSESPILIWNQSWADLSIQNSTLRGQATGGPSSAVQAMSGGSLHLQSSIVEAWGNGINMQDGHLIVSGSTFAAVPSATGVGVSLVGPGLLEITNSTLDERSVVVSSDVSGVMRHTTMRNAGLNDAATFDVLSSIVASCGGAISDLGNNVGDCFGTPVALGTPADNGCLAATPTGCAPTIALAPASPAAGAGRCEFVTTDQRGAARTPAGLGCDAGAYELAETLVGDVTDDGIVDNADAQALLDWLAGGAAPPSLSAGDVNDDGAVKLDDALAIAQLVANG